MSLASSHTTGHSTGVAPHAVPQHGSSFKAFISRFHFYVGLFVGPFLIVAAITGTLYALTPQIETWLYREQLTTTSTGEPQPLAAQVQAARTYIGDAPTLSAVRPTTGPGMTTRVMFTDPALGASESRAIFVDPVTLDIKGDLIAYGTSGILPFRTTLDYLHRSIMLGDLGRAYSELAASWLWILTLGGVLLWLWRSTGKLANQQPANKSLQLHHKHGIIGVVLSLGLLFLSATGLTWSQWAGARIDDLRNTMGWITPTVSTSLEGALSDTGGEHAEHNAAAAGGHAHHHTPGMVMPADDPSTRLDEVLTAAKAGGIDSPMLEIKVPKPGSAWVVREYDRAWPSQVDTVAINPNTMAVTSRADFVTFPISAKLVQWGIAAHMGLLFGIVNQLVLAVLGISLVAVVIYGYRIWWRHRPKPGALPHTLVQSWLRLNITWKAIMLVTVVVLGWALPVLGVSVVAFVLVDILRWRMAQPPAAA
ncbi:PepSY-associated TM helix domain-containing protein [Tianweitania populi]|uniref:Membrane protein n=1 Tax=Tianweitania populi TaxID=1607949 RepID=A0A8J3GM38_9HYPH|nr:PepSY-associated TM helix domain-containing protein [Tianweitania populi]GHD15262.1 membrane protein [Tianweitania populi]